MLGFIPMLHLALAATAAAVCTEVRDKLKAAHIDVRALIKSTLPAPPTNSTPEQLALSLTGQPNELFITWVLPSAGDVCADSHASIGSATFPASWSTYEAGVAGWEGHVYTAKMTGLTPGVQALYSVTSCGKTTGPVPFTGPMAVGPQAETLIAVMADMGTVIPLGYVVWLTKTQRYSVWRPMCSPSLTPYSRHFSIDTPRPHRLRRTTPRSPLTCLCWQ